MNNRFLPAENTPARDNIKMILVASFIGLCLGTAIAAYHHNAATNASENRRAECISTGIHTGYPVEYEAGVCWVSLSSDLALPWADAKELIKFDYKKEGARK